MNEEIEEIMRLLKTQPKTLFCQLIDGVVDTLMAIDERLGGHIETGDFEAFKFELECRQIFREHLSDYEQKLFGREIH